MNRDGRKRLLDVRAICDKVTMPSLRYVAHISRILQSVLIRVEVRDTMGSNSWL